MWGPVRQCWRGLGHDQCGVGSVGGHQHTDTLPFLSKHINRIQSELTYNGSNIALKQLVQWDPTMYLNIWVVHSSDGGNGSAFAFYPADVEGSASIYDGVVSSYWAVGRTETAVWTHYKILTHEVGHWANLKHTWGDQSGNQSTA